MKTIWRYSWGLDELNDEFHTFMPVGARIISAHTKMDYELSIWAEVMTTADKEKRVFQIRRTNHPLNGKEGKFIGTVIFIEYNLVFHIYESL